MSSQDKNYLIGFLSSFIIYVIFFSILALLLSKKPDFPKESRRVVNLGHITEEKIPPTAQSKPVVNKKQVEQKPQKQQKTPIRRTKTPKEIKKTVAPRDINKTIVQKAPKPQKPLNPLLAQLNENFKTARKNGGGSGDGMIKDLYGSEFDKMGKEEQKFVEDNLAGMGKTMQKYFDKVNEFNPPQERGRAYVEFYLKPNGDIEDLRIIKSSGYKLQDKNALETVELAFKDFPRPKTKTKIRWGFIIY